MTENLDWAHELLEDVKALKYASERDKRRRRRLNQLEVSDIQVLMARFPDEFAKLRLVRNDLRECLNDGARMGGGNSSSSSPRAVIHKQEGHVPDPLVQAYEALWIKCYGSEAVVIGDPSVIRGVGKGNQMRMKDSDERVTRSGANGGGDRGGSRRSIIKDERTFEFKRKIDKRIRRLAKEIDSYMRGMRAGEDEEGRRCWSCQKFMEEGWIFCPACGCRRQ